MPVREECGFLATLFGPTEAIGDRNRRDLDPPPTGLEIMSVEELRDVDARGFTVESHGRGHINLGAATAVSALDDLACSVEILTDLLGRAPRFLGLSVGASGARRRRRGWQTRFRCRVHNRDSRPRAVRAGARMNWKGECRCSEIVIIGLTERNASTAKVLARSEVAVDEDHSIQDPDCDDRPARSVS